MFRSFLLLASLALLPACSDDSSSQWVPNSGADAAADQASDATSADQSTGPDSSANDSPTPESGEYDTSAVDSSEPDSAEPEAAACLASMAPCTGADLCCDGRTCGNTTAGQVCCGNDGASCATADGSDCCGDLLCIDGKCQSGEAMFKAPYACGQSWTYDHHSAEVREAVDFIRDDGGETNGAPVLASAEGTATQHYEAGGAGNYVVIEHSGGWKTYYFHLSEFSVGDGVHVMQGQQIGLTGTTGASTGPHIHYEQLLNGAGQKVKINGVSLDPYPSDYGQKSLVSDNGCSGNGKPFMTWGNDRPVHAEPTLSSAVVGTVASPALVYVICQKQGEAVTDAGYTNDWWSKLDAPAGYISNIYIDDPAAKLPGVADCP